MCFKSLFLFIHFFFYDGTHTYTTCVYMVRIHIKRMFICILKCLSMRLWGSSNKKSRDTGRSLAYTSGCHINCLDILSIIRANKIIPKMNGFEASLFSLPFLQCYIIFSSTIVRSVYFSLKYYKGVFGQSRHYNIIPKIYLHTAHTQNSIARMFCDINF